MSYTIVSAKVDPKIKTRAQETAKDLGIPLSLVIKAFLKQFIRTRTITFSDRPNEIPNAYLEEVIKQAEKDWKQGKTSPVFKTGEEAEAWLTKQGV